MKNNVLALLIDTFRHQIIDIPPLAAAIVEHLLHAMRCPKCRKVTCAKLPDSATWSPFGPGLQATVALLMERYCRRRSESIGKSGLAEETRMFGLWERFKNGEITRQAFTKEFVPLKARMKRLLTRGLQC